MATGSASAAPADRIAPGRLIPVSARSSPGSMNRERSPTCARSSASAAARPRRARCPANRRRRSLNPQRRPRSRIRPAQLVDGAGRTPIGAHRLLAPDLADQQRAAAGRARTGAARCSPRSIREPGRGDRVRPRSGPPAAGRQRPGHADAGADDRDVDRDALGQRRARHPRQPRRSQTGVPVRRSRPWQRRRSRRSRSWLEPHHWPQRVARALHRLVEIHAP